MDDFIAILNGVISVAFSAVLVWGVLSPRVRDGVVVKFGMILMAIGFALSAALLLDGIDHADLIPLNRSRLLSHVGAVVAVVGWAWRMYRGERLHHLFDFSFLGSAQTEDEARA